jgi:hypothetical protein
MFYLYLIEILFFISFLGVMIKFVIVIIIVLIAYARADPTCRLFDSQEVATSVATPQCFGLKAGMNWTGGMLNYAYLDSTNNDKYMLHFGTLPNTQVVTDRDCMGFIDMFPPILCADTCYPIQVPSSSVPVDRQPAIKIVCKNTVEQCDFTDNSFIANCASNANDTITIPTNYTRNPNGSAQLQISMFIVVAMLVVIGL